MAISSALDFVRLQSNERSVANVWINEDIRPLPPHRRTWTRWAFVSFWAINQIALSNFQLGASLVAAGLAVWQAVIAIIIGKVIVAAVAVANG
jgi:NCS1 family nucleobase:cation symporter-1